MRRPAARIGAGVSSPRGDDPAAALNQVLSEVIDGVLDVKQAHRRVPETHVLHAVPGQLFDDLGTWARLLADQDRALGVSPLASMPTAAGRTPPHIRSLALVMAALESSWRGRRVRAGW